jgi:hypothetical protein
MSLVPLAGNWPDRPPRRLPTTFLPASRQLRGALNTAEDQAVEVAVRNDLLGDLTTQAVRNVHRYARAVQGMATDSMYVATAADTYFVELLEGQADALRRYRRGW